MTATAPKPASIPRRYTYQGKDITVLRIMQATTRALGGKLKVKYPSQARSAIISAATSGTTDGQHAANMVDEAARCAKFGLHAIYRPQESELEPWFKAICELVERRAGEIPDEDALPSCLPRQEVGLHMVNSEKVQARYGSVIRLVPTGSLLPHPDARTGALTESLGELDPFREDCIQRLTGNEVRMPDLLVQEVMEKEAVDQRGSEESLHDEVRDQIMDLCGKLGITFSTTRSLPTQVESIMAIKTDSATLWKCIRLRRLAQRQEERTARYVTQVSWKGSPILNMKQLTPQRDECEPVAFLPMPQEIAQQVNAIYGGTLRVEDAHRIVRDTYHAMKFGRTPQTLYARILARLKTEVDVLIEHFSVNEQPHNRKAIYAIAMENFGQASPLTIALAGYLWLRQERLDADMSENEHLIVCGLRSRRAIYDTLRVKARTVKENDQLMPLLREFAPAQHGRLLHLIAEVNKNTDPNPRFTDDLRNVAREIERGGLILGNGIKQHIGMI